MHLYLPERGTDGQRETERRDRGIGGEEEQRESDGAEGKVGREG